MRFEPTPVPGAFAVRLEPHSDERGFFARAFCSREFADQGLAAEFVQANLSFNRRRGTLRGLHFQSPPHREAKLIHCVRGAAFMVLADLRPESRAFETSWWTTLEADGGDGLYIPEGVANGFQTLEDDTELFYLMSAYYAPEAARGIRFDDPALAVPWPLEVTAISERDRSLPTLETLHRKTHE